MSLRDEVRVVQSKARRLKVFIDYWNVLINARSQTSFTVDLDWSGLAQQIVMETQAGFFDKSEGELAGCYIFGSFNRSNGRESSDVDRTLDQHGASSGIFFDFRERVRKESSIKCEHCGQQTRQTSEMGVDVLLTVEMIKHASMREHEYLALVSSDRDFTPLLSYLKDQGQRVIHVATGSSDRQMRSITWKQIELKQRYSRLSKIIDSDYLILTSPHHSEKKDEAVSIITAAGKKAKVFDLTDESSIDTRDLRFVLQNQGLYFWEKEKGNKSKFSAEKLCGTLNRFREQLKSGKIDGSLPHVIFDGKTVVYGTDDWRWTIVAGSEESEAWKPFQKKAGNTA